MPRHLPLRLPARPVRRLHQPGDPRPVPRHRAGLRRQRGRAHLRRQRRRRVHQLRLLRGGPRHRGLAGPPRAPGRHRHREDPLLVRHGDRQRRIRQRGEIIEALCISSINQLLFPVCSGASVPPGARLTPPAPTSPPPPGPPWPGERSPWGSWSA